MLSGVASGHGVWLVLKGSAVAQLSRCRTFVNSVYVYISLIALSDALHAGRRHTADFVVTRLLLAV
jgi:hypothetical protein